jgi:hypothetical protein
MSAAHWLESLAARLLPAHLRHSVLADLHEERPPHASPGWVVGQATLVALHFQAEPWRERGIAGRALLLLAAAGGLLWIVPMAARALLAQAGVFTDPASRFVLELWRADAVVAGIAAGLVLGRASLLPLHAAPARAQAALLLAVPATWMAHTPLQAALTPLLMLAAVWLGHHHLAHR